MIVKIILPPNKHGQMKKFTVLLAALFLTFATAVAAGENDAETKATSSALSISGSVEDLVSSEKLICAKIEIEELDMTIFTDILGNYEIPKIEPGNYTFKVSYIAYEELEIKAVEISSTKEMDIQLKPL